MFKIALPILGISDSALAERFYCGRLGFRRAHAYRPDPGKQDPCWMVVARDGARLVLSSFQGDGPPGSRNVQIYVEDAAALRRELLEAGVAAVGELLDQTWGNLEFGVVDPDGNQICFAQDKGG
jgi:catechol 2,3-dioxygenase-like lactoylglutathione lyase family enzyme